MRSSLWVVFLSFLAALFPSQSHALTPVPSHSWSRSFGDDNVQRAAFVAMDAGGNVYMAGAFYSTVNLGGGNLISAGTEDIFLAKFDASGVHQWSQRFGDALPQSVTSLATDTAGNVIVAGGFYGSVDFGGGSLVSAGETDGYLVKFSPAGTHQWSKRFGDANLQECRAVATDPAGNVLVTGFFGGTVNFGGANLVSAGGFDVYLAKFNPGGLHQWSQRFGDADNQLGLSVATDPSGNVVITGDMQGTVNFGGANLVSPTSYDIFLAKFASNGAHQWSQRFGDAFWNDEGTSVVADGASFIYLTGSFGGTVNFGGANLVSAGGFDVYLAKFNPGGLHQWSERYGDASTQVSASVATVDGIVCLTGNFEGSIDFGGGGLVSAGLNDAFLTTISWSGDHIWSHRYGDAASQLGLSIAMDASQNIALSGYFAGSVNFGGGDLTTSNQTTEIFVARFAAVPREPEIASVVDVDNDQGRKVRIRFARSGMDNSGSPAPITRYEVYRRNDPLPAAMHPDAPASNGWVYAGHAPAHGAGFYLLDALTDADSTADGGQHYSVFRICAATADPLVYYESPPDSGYSLDNLAPGVPGSLLYDEGVLSWVAPDDPDLDHFTVYGSDTESFASAVLIDYARETAFDTGGSPYAFYFITATDRAGNEGPAARVKTCCGTPGGTVANPALSLSAFPNPFNPSTVIRYTLPSRGHVTLSVFDARGARVATLLSTERDIGAHTTAWDGRDDNGRAVCSGVYFARLSHAAGTRTYKLLLLK
ncbi:MAG: T9SS type A sorting domain-containing protein [Candidatus Krumholzibacteria bacterium]|nr:T9SS type A sorting domain-containing protein [Candidatus Krumholzibacteria bacterium]MDH4338385.1 T9SS type A sorting domain-containing protein [Candidatus Krumholzibacteria bacterium]MDH5270856.1 T9SS type A sorting domain-containing protein [Candidatus Krumholzibacteria bacterium]